MSQPSSNIAPAVSSVPWANPDTASPTAAPGDRYGYAPESVTRQDVPPSYSRFPGTEYVDVQEVFADGGYTSPKPVTNPLAKTALWVSVFAIFGLPLIVGAVLAVIALMEAQKLPDRIGRHEAIAALIYDGIIAFVWASLYAL